MASILAIYFNGYNRARTKYEETIAKLEVEVDRLSDPIAVYEEATSEVILNLIQSKIQNIGELATIEYLYTDAGKFEDPRQLFGHNIPFTTKSFIAKWDGIIKAGVDINRIIIDVNTLSREIVIHIPPAEILSHEINENSIETLDEKDNIFNPIKIDDIRAFDAVSKDAMEKRAIENGLLDKAFENAKQIISELVNNDTVQKQKYTIRFEILE